ncbi:hypothetical protein FHG87_000619 [Trinorchestia longiramus]|nr:hypothetical protein FHG87_000619 [Trinorchestia longiramus]
MDRDGMENVCFKEELDKANRALLQVQQDKSFLLEQLLPYHQPLASSSDSDLTDYSDNENGSVALTKKKRVSEGSNAAPNMQVASQCLNGSSSSSAFPLHSTNSSKNPGMGGKGIPKPSISSKPSSVSAAAGTVAGGKKKAATAITTRGGKQPGRARQRRAPTKPTKDQASLSADRLGGQVGMLVDPTDGELRGLGEAELSREEVERHLLARQTIAELHTPVSLTLPNQLFSDNLMDGDLLSEEIETTSNLDDDGGGVVVYED